MTLCSLIAALALNPVAAGEFAEGFSSAEPGGSAELSYRAFTVVTGPEECAKSPQPAELKVYPNPLRLNIGDRIHRSNVSRQQSELVVEAYSADGDFLPSVPIVVSTIDTYKVIKSRSDWDYFEAKQKGEAELHVRWACETPDGVPVEIRTRIVVAADDQVED